jgi:hypothetical protein
MTASNFYRYTQNGKKDAENETANAFTIGTFGKMTDEAAYNAMNELISSYKNYVLESKATVQYKQGIVYSVYMLRNDNTSAFMARAFNDTDNYLTKFETTVQSVIDK